MGEIVKTVETCLTCGGAGRTCVDCNKPPEDCECDEQQSECPDCEGFGDVEMKTETKQALRAALETPAFAGVREALRAESKRATSEALVYHDEPAPAEDYWRNDGWQAAWRDMCETTTRGMVLCKDGYAAGYDGLAIFCACGKNLSGDDLAAELRDIALEERDD